MLRRKMNIRLRQVVRILAWIGLLSILLTGCGKEKEMDPASEQVLRISITPIATPTPVPEKLNPDAVTTNGSLMMTNDYVLENTPYEEADVEAPLTRPAGVSMLDAEADSEEDIYGESEEGTYEE